MCKFIYVTLLDGCRYIHTIERCSDYYNSIPYDKQNEALFVLIPSKNPNFVYCGTTTGSAGIIHRFIIYEKDIEDGKLGIPSLMTRAEWCLPRLTCQIKVMDYGFADVKCPYHDKMAWLTNNEKLRTNRDFMKQKMENMNQNSDRAMKWYRPDPLETDRFEANRRQQVMFEAERLREAESSKGKKRHS